MSPLFIRLIISALFLNWINYIPIFNFQLLRWSWSCAPVLFFLTLWFLCAAANIIYKLWAALFYFVKWNENISLCFSGRHDVVIWNCFDQSAAFKCLLDGDRREDVSEVKQTMYSCTNMRAAYLFVSVHCPIVDFC